MTDVVSVLERKRRLTQWDIKPPGYENVTAEQAKLSGMFPLPGAPRQQPMDPSKLAAFMAQPGGATTNAALKPSNSRQAKRLVIHNIPANATEESLVDFLNLQLNGLNVIEGSDPCISAQISKDRTFALAEFKTASDATVVLAMDGMVMEDGASNGAANGEAKGLSITRPKDYIVPAVDEAPHEPGVTSSVVPDTPNKISVSNIPTYLTDELVTELLVSFGELKAFVLIKDRSTEESRGIAFCEYVDPAATDIAVEGLNGMELADKHLKVQRASIGNTQNGSIEMSVSAMSMLAGSNSDGLGEGRVLQLLNMVTPEELIDNEDYEGMSRHMFSCGTALTNLQRFSRRSERSVRSTAKSWTSRFHAQVVAPASPPVLERSTSSLKPQKLLGRPSALLLDASSPTVLSLRHISPK